jgi:hypothetical protein
MSNYCHIIQAAEKQLPINIVRQVAPLACCLGTLGTSMSPDGGIAPCTGPGFSRGAAEAIRILHVAELVQDLEGQVEEAQDQL